MAHKLTMAILAAGAALMTAGAAQAGHHGSYGGGYGGGYGGYGGYRPVQSYGGGYGGGRHYGGHGYDGRPSGWHGGGHGCTLIVKRRVNRWGEMVVTRIRRCG